MKVINDLLNYKNLKIVQDSEWFMFSIDSVLLANFAKINKKHSIIDFCTGNAPIPLFLSERVTGKIIGVELQKEVYELALESVKINNLEKKIEILNCDVKDLNKIYETDTFDYILCNPPYFKITTESNINNNKIKATARHEITLNLSDIFKCAKKILKNNGKIAVIHRTDRLIDIISEMRNNNIEPKRLQFIFPKEQTKSNLVLVEGSKNGKTGLKVESPIIVHKENGDYTSEIKILFSGGKNEN